MSLYNFLYKLQRRPAKYKIRVLISLLVACFVVLAVFWVVMFKSQVLKTNSDYSSNNGSPTIATVGSESMMSPLTALVDGFKSFQADVSNKIKDLGQQLGNSSQDARSRPVYELPQN